MHRTLGSLLLVPGLAVGALWFCAQKFRGAGQCSGPLGCQRWVLGPPWPGLIWDLSLASCFMIFRPQSDHRGQVLPVHVLPLPGHAAGCPPRPSGSPVSLPCSFPSPPCHLPFTCLSSPSQGSVGRTEKDLEHLRDQLSTTLAGWREAQGGGGRELSQSLLTHPQPLQHRKGVSSAQRWGWS